VKMWFYFLVFLCSFAVATDGQQMKAPTCYLKAGKFLELGESERLTYITGLMDGFYGSAMFGASEDTVGRLNACMKDMDSKQVTAIVYKYVSDHPQWWHMPLSVEAYNALNDACPGQFSPKK
jgi:hypothetical protein